jgi:hypothetical protein
MAARGDNFVPVDDEEVSINFDCALCLSMDRIVLVLLGHVIRGGRAGVDSLQRNFRIVHRNTCNKMTNTSKTINTHACGHLHVALVGDRGLEGRSTERGRALA